MDLNGRWVATVQLFDASRHRPNPAHLFDRRLPRRQMLLARTWFRQSNGQRTSIPAGNEVPCGLWPFAWSQGRHVLEQLHLHGGWEEIANALRRGCSVDDGQPDNCCHAPFPHRESALRTTLMSTDCFALLRREGVAIHQRPLGAVACCALLLLTCALSNDGIAF